MIYKIVPRLLHEITVMCRNQMIISINIASEINNTQENHKTLEISK